MARLLLVLALVTLGSSDSRAKAQCHHQCFTCETRCHHDAACRRTCLEMKRACCQSKGFGPGPHDTCDCS